MSLIEFETYCTACGYAYVDEESVPIEQEIVHQECDCGAVILIHRCSANAYAEMSVRELKK